MCNPPIYSSQPFGYSVASAVNPFCFTMTPTIFTSPQANRSQTLFHPIPESLPTMHRRAPTKEPRLLKGSTITVPPPGPVSSIQHHMSPRTMTPQPYHPAQVMVPGQPLGYPYMVQGVPSIPVNFSIPSSQVLVHPDARTMRNLGSSDTFSLPTLIPGRGRQQPECKRQRTAVPMEYELSKEDRVYFTAHDRPGLLVSDFIRDVQIVDGGDRLVSAFCRRSGNNIAWMLHWPGYPPKSQMDSLGPNFTLKQLAARIVQVVSHLVIEPRDPSLESKENSWRLGPQGITPNRVWLVSFGLLEGSTSWWAPEFEVEL